MKNHCPARTFVLACLLAATAARSFASTVPGGALSGRVTASESGRPLAGLHVDVWSRAAATWAATTTTRGDGTYRVPALAAGGYLVYAYGDNRVGEAWPGDICPWGRCGRAGGGDAVVVRAGGVTRNIDFALALGSTLSGRLRNTDRSPVSNGSVDVSTRGFDYIGHFAARADGRYEVTGLPPETYVLRGDAPSHFSHYWRDGQCDYQNCGFGNAEPIVLGAAVTRRGLDITLPLAGSLAGTIRDAETGAPLRGWIRLYREGGALGAIDTVASGDDGTFLAKPIHGGSYRLVAQADGHPPTLYGAADCPFDGCDLNAGRVVQVPAGAATVGVEIELGRGATLAGRVVATGTDTGVAAGVVLRSTTGPGVVSFDTAADGSFAVSGLGGGEVWAEVVGRDPHFVATLQPDIDCAPICNVVNGTPIQIAARATTTVTLNANPGAIVRGHLTAAATGAVTGLLVVAANPSHPLGELELRAFHDGDAWEVDRLPPGDWSFYTVDDRLHGLGLVEQAYPGQSCPLQTCAEPQRVHIAAGEDVSGIDFTLAVGATIAGRLVDRLTGVPVVGAEVFALDGSGVAYDSAVSDRGGAYRLSQLPAGTYYVGTSPRGQHWIPALYPDRVCAGLACDPRVVGAKAVTVVAGGRVDHVNVYLDRGAVLSGKVRTPSGAPAFRARVRVLDRGGVAQSVSTVSGDGGWRSLALPPGTYYVNTDDPDPSLDHAESVSETVRDLVPELFPGVPCHRGLCGLELGTPVVIPEPEPSGPVDVVRLHFLLSPGASVSGTIRDATTGRPLPGVTVAIGSPGSSAVADTARTDEVGRFRIRGVAPGTYVVRTLTYPGYVAQAWPGVECPGGVCDRDSIQPVEVGADGIVDGVDFSLGPEAATVRGRVADGEGQPLSGVVVRAWRVDGDPEEDSSATDLAGIYVLHGLPAGEHRLVTQPAGDTVRVLRADVDCPGAACRRDGGAPLLLKGDEGTAVADFSLGRGPQIVGRVTDALTGAPLSGVEIELFDAAEAFLGAVRSQADGRYATSGVAPGTTVFVRTARTFDYRDQAWSGIDCETTCTADTATPITVGEEDVVANFALVP